MTSAATGRVTMMMDRPAAVAANVNPSATAIRVTTGTMTMAPTLAPVRARLKGRPIFGPNQGTSEALMAGVAIRG